MTTTPPSGSDRAAPSSRSLPFATVRGSATEADITTLEQLIRQRQSTCSPASRVLPACLPRADRVQLTSEQLADHERRVQDREAKDRERERRLRIQQQAEILHSSAGERYRNCRLANFVTSNSYQKRVVETVRVYCSTVAERCRAGEGIVLYGPVGTGKDHLAYAVAMAAVAAELTIGWLSGQEWYGQLRDAIDEGTSEQTLVGRIRRPDFVVFSDPLPPGGQLTTYQAAMLFRAIDARYARGKATVVTVNLADDAEADQRFGAATWDRLCHNTWKLFCNWPSHRRPVRDIRN